VPVYVSRADGASPSATVTLTATSVSDETKTATATCAVAAGTVGGNVPATLSLSLGPAASFGVFTPGIAREYTASTAANVISTAGDASLSVSDPGI
jgi:hypothetical protein